MFEYKILLISYIICAELVEGLESCWSYARIMLDSCADAMTLRIKFGVLLFFLMPIEAIAESTEPLSLFVQTYSKFQVDGDFLSLPYERENFGFSDRPNRLHTYLDARRMVELWAAGNERFRVDPPNAVSTWIADGRVKGAEVELLSASVDPTGKLLSYRFTSNVNGELAATPSYASLFIDDLIDTDVIFSSAYKQVEEGVEEGTAAAFIAEPPSPASLVDLGVGELSRLAESCP